MSITNSTKDAIIMIDQSGIISFWNPAAEAIFGYKPHDAIGNELHLLLMPPKYHATWSDGLRVFSRTGTGSSIGKTIELTALRKGGAEFPIELSLSTLKRNEAWHAVGVIRDITARKKSEDELQSYREQLEHIVETRTAELSAVNELLRREARDRALTEEELSKSRTFLASAFDSFHDPFSILDREYRIIKLNDAYARLKGRPAGELEGKMCYRIFHNRSDACPECIVTKTLLSKDPCAQEKLIVLSDGSEAWVEIYTYPILDPSGNVTHVVEYSRDITDRRKSEEEKKQLIKKLNHLSTTDGLTGLLNRRALIDLLQHEIDRAGRYDKDLSLILCDVDKFKSINDSYGHTAGDLALRAVAEALRTSLRKADIVGRYGGDEFMIIMPETSLEGARILAEKILASVRDMDIELPGGVHVHMTMSLGIADCCSVEENIDTLVALADSALYASKEKGRNRISVKKQSERASIEKT